MNEIVYVYGVIYKITNSINGKIYIGQTIHSIQERLNGHIKQAEKFETSQQMLITRAIKKYGKENFTIEVISSAFNKNELNFKEKFYIKLYNSFAKNGLGYNVAEGGNFGNAYAGKTKEEIAKISEKQRKNHTGRIIINNGVKYICCLKKELIYYLSNGWELGKGNVVDEQTLKQSRLKNGDKHKDTVWMNNGLENIKVKKEDKKLWLNKSFLIGRLSNKIWISKNEFEMQIDKKDLNEFVKIGFKTGRKISPIKNRIVINDGIKNKTIESEELENYLKDGWNKGAVKRGKGRLKTIHKENEQKQIPFDELDIYLNNGWELGMKKQPNRKNTKGVKAVHKNEELKFIKESEIDYYLSLGYNMGRPKSKRRKKDSFHQTDEVKEKIRQKIKNKTWLNNGIENKYLNKEDVEPYISQGWKRGKLEKVKKQ